MSAGVVSYSPLLLTFMVHIINEKVKYKQQNENRIAVSDYVLTNTDSR